MKKYKSFTYAALALLMGYCLFNVTVWELYTKRLLNDPANPNGDLTRMGYISGSKAPRLTVGDLPVRHWEEKDYRGGPVDVITIGDSFSNGGAGGRNPYYQDYIATLSGARVLNIPEFKQIDKISTVSLLNNNGYLDRIRPKSIIIECSEKLLFNDLPERYDFDRSIPEEELKKYPVVDFHPVPPKDTRLVKLDCFTEANCKLVRNSICYNFSDHAYWSPVYKAKLNRPYFSVQDADTLLFYQADIRRRQLFTPANVAKLNDALNTLHDRLAQKGIELYFMPCVDKYDLYSDYIVNNKYPPNNFFPEIRKLPRRYRLIDTKAILKQALEKGEKDIYYADDTHWGWKAAEVIFQGVRFPVWK